MGRGLSAPHLHHPNQVVQTRWCKRPNSQRFAPLHHLHHPLYGWCQVVRWSSGVMVQHMTRNNTRAGSSDVPGHPPVNRRLFAPKRPCRRNSGCQKNLAINIWKVEMPNA